MAAKNRDSGQETARIMKYLACAIVLFVAASALVSMMLDDRPGPDPHAVNRSIATGFLHSAAIKSDGTLWLWGEGGYGQIGDGLKEDQHEPVKVLDDVVSISIRGRYSMAIKKDNSLWAWGMNHFGQFGNGTDEDSATPIKVLDRVAAVYPGGTHTMAILFDGTLWAWGMNDVGQLASKIEPPASIYPSKIMENVADAAAGGSSSLAVKKDGSLWAWGWNYFGQLGDGTTEDRIKPVKIMDDAATVFSGFNHSMAIKKDGSLWAWGSNHYGQLGDGTTQDRPAPVKIMDDVVSITGSEMFSLAVRKDGSLWGWGTETNGALSGAIGGVSTPGDNVMRFDMEFFERLNDPDDPLVLDEEYMEALIEENSANQETAPYTSVPVKLMDDVTCVSATAYHILVTKKDGSLWSWGRNDFGQLGDGSATPNWAEARPEPVHIMDDIKSFKRS